MVIFYSHSNKSSNEKTVDKLIQTVSSNPKDRYKALVSLKKIGDPKAIGTFYQRLNDPSSRIRRVSIEALGEMGNAHAISYLANLINTNDFYTYGKTKNFGHPENIELAKEAIRKIQQRSQTPEPINSKIPSRPPHTSPPNDGLKLINIPPETNQLIRTLISELENNSNIDFRNSAATQLGSFHEPYIVKALIKCVKNDPKVRYRALAALRKIGDPIAIPVFIERLKDSSARIRLVSVIALGEIGDSAVVKPLESHIQFKDYKDTLKSGGNPEIIQAAKDAIQKIRSRKPEKESLVPPPPVDPEHELIKIQKIDAKIKKGLAREIIANGELPFIMNCARHKHNDIRKHANYALGNLTLNGEAEQVIQAGAVPILIGTLSDPYEWARSSSAWALSTLAEKGQAQNLVKTGAIQPLITGLKDSDNLVRGCSARALDKIAFAGFSSDLVIRNAVPPLIHNLEDNCDNVRKKSIWTLWSIAVKGKTDIFGQDSVLKPLIRCVLDKDVEVRSGTLNLLGVLGRKGLSERIIIAGITPPLVKSLSSRSIRVRGFAAWALGEIDRGMMGDEFILSGAISELEKISDDSNKILIYNETDSSWSDKPIHEIVNETLRILRKKEKPELILSLDRTQLSAERSHKLGVTLTNTGVSDFENVVITFSSEFETKGIKPISVKAGQSSRTDINITPKTVGNVLLDITLTYKDIKGGKYRNVQEFWIDVAGETLQQDLPPEFSERYPESKIIGKGGFAKVFKAKRKDGKYVAVKIPISLDESTGKTFIAELQNWTQLNHPNIVKVYNYNIMPLVYFEMELCDNSLADQEKPIDSKEAAQIISDVCEGLKFTHSKKIIHRDLKPKNILLKNGVPKISDWGLSRVISESTSTTTTSFTPHYAAPEQFGNKPKDERTDIWQLGVIFYELVTGLLPFTGDSLTAVMKEIETKNPQIPSEIIPSSRDVEVMIMKCLEKNPGKRYQSVIELQKDIILYLRKSYKELFDESVTANDIRGSAFYCAKIVMMSLSTGDINSAYTFLLDFAHYSKGDVKVEAQELAGQLKFLIDHGDNEISDELIQKAEIIVHKVNLGSGTM